MQSEAEGLRLRSLARKKGVLVRVEMDPTFDLLEEGRCSARQKLVLDEFHSSKDTKCKNIIFRESHPSLLKCNI